MEIEIRREYFLDGGILHEKSYINNVQHGNEIRYWSNGEIAWEVNYKNGLMHGIFNFYDENKKIKKYISI